MVESDFLCPNFTPLRNWMCMDSNLRGPLRHMTQHACYMIDAGETILRQNSVCIEKLVKKLWFRLGKRRFVAACKRFFFALNQRGVFKRVEEQMNKKTNSSNEQFNCFRKQFEFKANISQSYSHTTNGMG